jgi:hypothetical protein
MIDALAARDRGQNVGISSTRSGARKEPKYAFR